MPKRPRLQRSVIPVRLSLCTGHSTDPPETFGLDGYADCLAGFLQKLGLETAFVAGLSFGGILARALSADTAPRRARILASAYAGWAGSLPPEVAEPRVRQALPWPMARRTSS